MNKYMKKSRQDGATLVELIYVIPLFFLLMFSIFEVAYLYRSKATLNVATFDAARSGSLNNASPSAMKSALANGMMPLFVGGDKSAGGIASAYVKSHVFGTALSAISGVPGVRLDSVVTISPNRAMYNKFKKPVSILDESTQRFRFVDAIPNDNLQFRSTRTERIRVGGDNVDVNLQDANLLKIKTLWCHKMKVPGFRDMIYRTVLGGVFGISPEQRYCNALRAGAGQISGSDDVYIAITAHSVIRMQSPVFVTGLQ
ncbi:MAG: hypothetical protein ACJAYF_001651 [Arenicella sp.]|jgi:hypothetical protein